MEKGKEHFLMRYWRNAALAERVEFFIFLAVLIAIQSVGISKLSMPFVLEDEFGYLSHAANFAGLDWTSAAKFMSYYSYGYSLLLTPIFAIFKDTAVIYKAVLALNVLMIAGCFAIAKKVAKKLAPDMNGRLLNIATFVVCLYPSYIVQSKVAWTECILYLLFWAVLLTVICVNEKPKLWKCALLGFLAAYTYAVHNRGLSIAAAAIATVILMTVLKRIRLRDAAAFFAVLAVCFLGYTLINNALISSIWQGENGFIRNGYASQLTGGKLSFIFSMAGIKNVIKRLLGQVFYLAAATAGIGILGFIELCTENVTTLKHCSKKYGAKPFMYKENSYAYVFLLLAVLATVAISVFFTAGEGTVRADIMVYGRYNEIVAGPVILLGFLALVRSAKGMQLKSIAVSVAICVLGLLTYRWMLANGTGNYNDICAIGLAFILKKGDFSSVLKSSLVAAAVFVAASGAMICAGKAKCRRVTGAVCAAAMLAVGGCYLYIGENNLNNSVLSMSGENGKYQQIANYLEMENNEDLPVYYIIYDDFGKDRTKDFIQFSMRDEKLICIRPDELSKHPEDKYLLVYNSIGSDFIKEARGYEVLLMANDRVLLKTSENKEEILSGMEITGLYLADGVTAENGSYISTDNGGIFIFGPYFTIAQGSYDITLDAERVSGSADGSLGYAEVVGNGGTDKYDVLSFTEEDFADGTLHASLHMEAPVDITRIELRVEAAKGVVLKISDVRLNIAEPTDKEESTEK